MLPIISFWHTRIVCNAQAAGEKKKKNLFGKKLSFTKGKERIGSEDTLSGEECKLISSYVCKLASLAAAVVKDSNAAEFSFHSGLYD